ncbi:MAG: class I SAM-dependent methyltransferase [Egibacteraceae bacterium]
MDDPQAYMEANRRLWERWTPLHVRSRFYDLDGFRQGGVRIPRLEQDEVGDVAGRSLLHLQCHFGIDTLSWARLGATVTGVDFSGEAIEAARSLAAELALPATFVQANVYDLPQVLDGTFDVVYTSQGALPWLPDLRRWAQIAARFVKPGGVCYLFEAHPAAYIFDDEVSEALLRARYPYFGQPEPFRCETAGSYAVPDAPVTGVEHTWSHSLGEIVTAVIEAGLRLEFLHEFPFVFFRMLSFLERGGDGWWRLPDGLPSVPLSFSIRAAKP